MALTFDDMRRILEEQDENTHYCIYCKLPFIPRRRGQKTCGSYECSVRLKRDRQKSYRNDPERKEKAREYQKQYRNARKKVYKYNRKLDRLQEKYERMQKQDELMSEVGMHYGEYQVQKTLAEVPKIDVEGFMRQVEESKRRKENEK